MTTGKYDTRLKWKKNTSNNYTIHFLKELFQTQLPDTMTDEYPLINREKVIEDAYHAGYNRFHDSDTVEEPDMSFFHDSATYANHVLPDLRAKAGYADSAGGTYTVEREIAMTDYMAETVEIIDSYHLFDTLVSAWNRGAEDALRGDDPNVEYFD